MDRRTFLTTVALAAPVLGQSRKPAPAAKPPAAPAGQPGIPWTQWGGPNRNFKTEASGLKDTWPASGPRVVWKRALGDGYSSTVVENDTLYTMYARSGQEVVLAAKGETGETIW